MELTSSQTRRLKEFSPLLEEPRMYQDRGAGKDQHPRMFKPRLLPLRPSCPEAVDAMHIGYSCCTDLVVSAAEAVSLFPGGRVFISSDLITSRQQS